MSRLFSSVVVALIGLAPVAAQAQGFLIITEADQPIRLPRPIIIWPPYPHPHPVWPRPEPPATYKVSELEVNARLVDQVARVQVAQTFVNTGSRQLEAQFVFPLPYDGAIEQMTLMVDGKEFASRLLKADEARRIYEDIVRRSRDPALLEWIGTGMFKTSVFPVPPGARRTVSLRYAQLLRKSEGLTDFLFPLSTAKYTSQPVEKVEIRLSIESQQEIKNVYSPSHPVQIKRPDDRHATVTLTSHNEVPSSDFRLLYDVGQGKVGAGVLSYRPQADEDGYFLLLASPQIKADRDQHQRKTVLFVIDRSGSMSGKKIEQVRSALKFVLNNLRPGDLFNIVAYDSVVETFRPELQRLDEDTRKAALGFVEGLYAGGSTNIDGALKTALDQLQDNRQPAYVVFLTDGLPTTGETNEMKIVANAALENKVRARLFCFGVGYDVNSRLLEKLARENHGQVEYVRPNEDIEDRISRLYGRIESPVMTDVQIEITVDEARAEEGRSINRVYPRGSFDLFSGEQLVVVGRYKKAGAAKVVVRGKVGDRQQQFDFPAELVRKSNDESLAFAEKLWAVRRVGEILDEIDLKGKNDELIKELVELSIRHGILTPYTSFLADENRSLHDVTLNTREAGRRLSALKDVSGYGGVAQRAMRGDLMQAAQAAPAAAATAGAFAARPPAYRVGGGGLGGQPAATPGPAPALSYSWAGDAAKEANQTGQNVRNVGNRAFYRRGNQWVDATLTEKQQAQPRRVKQFSDEYFALARQHGRQMSQYLVFEEPVMLNVEGQALLVEP